MVRKRLEDTTTTELDAILATNVRTQFILCRELLRPGYSSSHCLTS